jgi:hypothetical protein
MHPNPTGDGERREFGERDYEQLATAPREAYMTVKDANLVRLRRIEG